MAKHENEITFINHPVTLAMFASCVFSFACVLLLCYLSPTARYSSSTMVCRLQPATKLWVDSLSRRSNHELYIHSPIFFTIWKKWAFARDKSRFEQDWRLTGLKVHVPLSPPSILTDAWSRMIKSVCCWDWLDTRCTWADSPRRCVCPSGKRDSTCFADKRTWVIWSSNSSLLRHPYI